MLILLLLLLSFQNPSVSVAFTLATVWIRHVSCWERGALRRGGLDDDARWWDLCPSVLALTWCEDLFLDSSGQRLNITRGTSDTWSYLWCRYNASNVRTRSHDRSDDLTGLIGPFVGNLCVSSRAFLIGWLSNVAALMLIVLIYIPFVDAFKHELLWTGGNKRSRFLHKGHYYSTFKGR